ncbi:MAG: oxaloacetate decarboxylase subunit alpha, partial [Clostridia bacterium]|nr:oxaloacetate decarboxylase subunit alpha [Clostridia bacterium]
ADDIAPELEKYREECKEYATSEEDVLSYALFNQVAVNFFKYRLAKTNGVDKDLCANKDKVYPA